MRLGIFTLNRWFTPSNPAPVYPAIVDLALVCPAPFGPAHVVLVPIDLAPVDHDLFSWIGSTWPGLHCLIPNVGKWAKLCFLVAPSPLRCSLSELRARRTVKALNKNF